MPTNNLAGRFFTRTLIAGVILIGVSLSTTTQAQSIPTLTGRFTVAYPGYESLPLVIGLTDASGYWGIDPIFLLPRDQQMNGTYTGNAARGQYTVSLPATPNGRAFDVTTGKLDDQAVTSIYDVRLYSDITDRGYMVENEDPIASSMAIEVDYEISGGSIFVFAKSAAEFPTGVGADEKLFTSDDPRAPIQAGYTRVDLTQTPYALTPVTDTLSLDLVTTGAGDVNDYSNLKCADLIPTFLTRVQKYYGFTELKNIDWEAIRAELIPASKTASEGAACEALILRFAQYIPDGHFNYRLPSIASELNGSMGMLVAQTSDGKIIAWYVRDNSPAAQAGIQAGAEIIGWDGLPVTEALDKVTLRYSNAGTPAALVDLQITNLIRGNIGTTAAVEFINPGEPAAQTGTVTRGAATRANIPAEPIPVSDNVLPSGLGYIRIQDFGELSDLTQFDAQVTDLIGKNVPGIIIDVRSNPGGFSQMSDAMSSRFFTEPFVVGDQIKEDGRYTYISRIDPREPIYNGKVYILVNYNTASSGDLFAYTFKVSKRATIVGHTPSAGMMGTVSGGQYQLPNRAFMQVSTYGFYDKEGNHIVEGQGVAPDLVVPLTIESLQSAEDEVFRAAEAALLKEISGN